MGVMRMWLLEISLVDMALVKACLQNWKQAQEILTIKTHQSLAN